MSSVAFMNGSGLHFAENGHNEVVKLLIDYIADMSAVLLFILAVIPVLCSWWF